MDQITRSQLLDILHSIPWSYPWGYWHPKTGYGMEELFPSYYLGHVCQRDKACSVVAEPPSEDAIQDWLNTFGHYFVSGNVPKVAHNYQDEIGPDQ